MESGVFKPEDIVNLHDREMATRQLETLGNFWIGPDVALEKKVVIPPLCLVRNVNLVINKNDLPAMNINRGALGSLSWSVRSFLAQCGIEIRFHRSDLSDEMIGKINAGKDVAIPVAIENHGQRAVELEGEVMRFFWVNDKNRLRGENLRKAIGKDLIIEGEEGKDWSFLDADPESKTYLNKKYIEQMKDLAIKLTLREKKFYIPPLKQPVRIKSKKDLPSVLREIPKGLDLQFKIGETAKVKLSENIIAVINTGAYDRGERHIRSPLIDSGANLNIRTETVEGLDYIELFLYRK